MRSPKDDDGYRDAYQQARKAQNEAESVVWKLVLVPVALLIFAGIFGGVIWYAIGQKNGIDRSNAAGGAPAAPVTPQRWTGEATYECIGNTRAALSGQTITSGASPAIRANGNCQLTLTDMTITAPVVLEVGGNAKVVIVGGALTGGEQAITAGANGKVSVSGTMITGDVERTGLAEIIGL